jgi:hypothetical protein
MLLPWLLWHRTLTHHPQAAQPSWPIRLSSTLYLEALLRPKNLSLTAFHFYIFGYNFLRYTCLKPDNSLSLHHSFICLGKTCHSTANAKPTDFNPIPVSLYVSGCRGSDYHN